MCWVKWVGLGEVGWRGWVNWVELGEVGWVRWVR